MNLVKGYYSISTGGKPRYNFTVGIWRTGCMSLMYSKNNISVTVCGD